MSLTILNKRLYIYIYISITFVTSNGRYKREAEDTKGTFKLTDNAMAKKEVNQKTNNIIQNNT